MSPRHWRACRWSRPASSPPARPPSSTTDQPPLPDRPSRGSILRLLLMRHGQTHANVPGELDTAHPGLDLTELGRAQAVAAAKALADEHLGAISVSSRVRTHQPAAPTAEDRGLTPTQLDGLEEIAAGDFEMRS